MICRFASEGGPDDKGGKKGGDDVVDADFTPKP